MRIQVLFFFLVLPFYSKANTPGLARIEDNSVLLEEAYNQERGVVQFIQSLQWNKKSRTFNYTFTNELPIADGKNQFSYTIPLTFNKSESRAQGVGDVSLQYRIQWVKKRDEVLVATKFSLLTPTGDVRQGLGNGRYGSKVNHAITSILSDFFVAHYNFGLTYYPQAENSMGGSNSSVGFNYGAGLCYMQSDTFNFFTEVFAADDEIVNDGKGSDVGSTRQSTYIVSPGMRFAINNEDGSQLVPGISFPLTIGLNGADSERGVILYLSFEDQLW
jgi:hypothetical protein